MGGFVEDFYYDKMGSESLNGCKAFCCTWRRLGRGSLRKLYIHGTLGLDELSSCIEA